MNRNCSACNIIIDIYNYKKDRTVCKSCYNINKRKNNNIILPQIKILKTLTIKRNKKIIITKITTLIFHHMKIELMLLSDPETLVKRFICLKYLKKIGDQRPIHIITRSPNQYPNYKTSNEIMPINKYKGSIVFF